MRFGKTTHREFGGTVDAQPGRAVNAGCRTGVEDACVRCVLQKIEAGACAANHTGQIDRNHLVNFFIGHVLDRSTCTDSSVVEQHRHMPASMLRELSNCFGPLRPIGHVQLVRRTHAGG